MQERRHLVLQSCLFMVCLFGASVVMAANSSTITSTEAYATIHHMGLYVSYDGDDNTNAKAAVRYRAFPGGSWQQGHPLLRVPKKRWVGSLFALSPNQEYEIEVTIQDPDGAPGARVFRGKTRAETPPPQPANGNHLYVDAARGKPGATGTKADPLNTIQAAADRTKPGDTVHVMPGVYREALVIKKAGTAARPILYVAEGKGVILDGADPTIQSTPTWAPLADGVYTTPFSRASLYVAADDIRLYDYAKLADLQNENGRQSGQKGLIKGGFFVDTSAKKLYLRMPNRTPPGNHTIHVAVLDVAILLETTSYIILRGFELRYYGGNQYGSIGIDVRNSHHCWIQQNHIHHMNAGIRVRKTAVASNNVIEDNQLRDTSVWRWPWKSVKAHTPEASAITIGHGRGNIVRRNRTEGHFNGIYTGSFSSQKDESIAQDTDVYDNQMAMHGDDGLEPEGASVNVRFVRNTILNVYNGISLAPIQVGPLWAIRTALINYKAHALKLNNGSVGWMLIYHTTSLPDPAVPGAQAIAPSIPFGGLISRNNIWASNRYVIEYGGTSLKGPISFDYDLLWTARSGNDPWFKWKNVRYKDIAAFTKGTGFATHSIGQQPAFADANANNFGPAPGSPMIDKGVWLEGVNRSTTAGAMPDIGAFERGKPRPPVEEPGGREEPAPTEPQLSEPGQETAPTERPAPPTDAGSQDASSADQTKPDTIGQPDAGANPDPTTKQDAPGAPDKGVTKDNGPAELPAKGGCQCDATPSSGQWLWVLLTIVLMSISTSRRQ